jgi:hypothetical protein
MTLRSTHAGTAPAACVVVAAMPKATTIAGGFVTWTAAVETPSTPSNVGLSDGSGPLTSFLLSDGVVMSFARADDRVYAAGLHRAALSNGYTDVPVDRTCGNPTCTSPTCTSLGDTSTTGFASSVPAPELHASPDWGLFNAGDTILVTLPDCTAASFTGSHPFRTRTVCRLLPTQRTSPSETSSM